mgnify:FL=1|nr:MAG TPA: Putative ABC-transporter type IV [Caudoviricetes sp.]
MKVFSKEFILFIIGGLLYILIELSYRGYSHWTMFILGGLCFVLIGGINNYISWDMPVYEQMMIGSVIITMLEFICGCIVNLWLGWDVWDYSNMPYNVLGQICLPFSILWFFISLVAIVADDYIIYWLFDEEKPRYNLG